MGAIRVRAVAERRAFVATGASLGFALIAAIVALFPSPLGSGQAHASESVSYCYDALGRLTQAGRVGGPAAGKTTDTAYDPAGNRLNQTTASGAVDCNDPTGAGGVDSGGGGGDPPTGPSFSVGNAQGTEGDILVFTITKTGATSSSYSVSYATANGTAQGADYTAVSGTLTFASSETTKTVSVPTTSDAKAEGTETFYLNLSSPTGGATIADGQGVGTLFNDDSICPTC